VGALVRCRRRRHRGRRLEAPGKVRLAVEIVLAYLKVRRTLRRTGLQPTIAMLRPPPLAPGAPGGERQNAARLAHAVRRTLAPLPGDTRCLTQALVLRALLTRRGLPSTLVIGACAAPAFAAHAWVELEGRPLLPDGGGRYGRLLEL
jgi:hypothetical protein